jgi:hypothetical protein
LLDNVPKTVLRRWVGGAAVAVISSSAARFLAFRAFIVYFILV